MKTISLPRTKARKNVERSFEQQHESEFKLEYAYNYIAKALRNAGHSVPTFYVNGKLNEQLLTADVCDIAQQAFLFWHSSRSKQGLHYRRAGKRKSVKRLSTRCCCRFAVANYFRKEGRYAKAKERLSAAQYRARFDYAGIIRYVPELSDAVYQIGQLDTLTAKEQQQLQTIVARSHEVGSLGELATVCGMLKQRLSTLLRKLREAIRAADKDTNYGPFPLPVVRPIVLPLNERCDWPVDGPTTHGYSTMGQWQTVDIAEPFILARIIPGYGCDTRRPDETAILDVERPLPIASDEIRVSMPEHFGRHKLGFDDLNKAGTTR